MKPHSFYLNRIDRVWRHHSLLCVGAAICRVSSSLPDMLVSSTVRDSIDSSVFEPSTLNYPLLSRVLGIVCLLIGGSMSFSLPFAYPSLSVRTHLPPADSFERAGAKGLLISMAISLVVGTALLMMGRRHGRGPLYQKEAMAVVGLSWVMATVLGALPYYFADVSIREDQPITLVESMFESQSGFSTTGRDGVDRTRETCVGTTLHSVLAFVDSLPRRARDCGVVRRNLRPGVGGQGDDESGDAGAFQRGGDAADAAHGVGVRRHLRRAERFVDDRVHAGRDDFVRWSVPRGSGRWRRVVSARTTAVLAVSTVR